MNQFISKIYFKHKRLWSRENFLLLLGGILLLTGALIFQHVAYGYIEERVTVKPVGDLLLDNLPTLNLDFFIVQGALVLTLFITILFVLNPHYIPFSLKALALFLIIRSFFISLTHLGADLHQIMLNQNSLGFGMYDFLYNAKNDFFFSGHVGAPFLFALIFWRETFWRNVFLLASFMFGVSMIFGHMHYSIDVFAAPFITYSIFIISQKLFKKDFTLIL